MPRDERRTLSRMIWPTSNLQARKLLRRESLYKRVCTLFIAGLVGVSRTSVAPIAALLLQAPVSGFALHAGDPTGHELLQTGPHHPES